MTFQSLLQAYFIGWAVAAPIGPVNLEIIRRALRHRTLAGFMTGLGATTADLIYVLLTGFGFAPFLQNPAVMRASHLLGGTLLLILSWGALRDGIRRLRQKTSRGSETENCISLVPALPLHRHWATGLGMTLLNPMTIAFWAALPGALFKGAPGTPLSIFTIGILVWLGAFSWVVTLTLFLFFARRVAAAALVTAASLIGGVLMAFFGLRFLWLA